MNRYSFDSETYTRKIVERAAPGTAQRPRSVICALADLADNERIGICEIYWLVNKNFFYSKAESLVEETELRKLLKDAIKAGWIVRERYLYHLSDAMKARLSRVRAKMEKEREALSQEKAVKDAPQDELIAGMLEKK